jgi:hypothetical protein
VSSARESFPAKPSWAGFQLLTWPVAASMDANPFRLCPLIFVNLPVSYNVLPEEDKTKLLV